MLRHDLGGDPGGAAALSALRQCCRTPQPLFGWVLNRKSCSARCNWLILKKKTSVILLGAGLGFILAAGPATVAQAHTVLTPNAPAESQAFEGLIPGDAACGDTYRIAGTDLCTHGPDKPPPSADVESAGGAQNENPPASAPIVCDEEGTNDHRIQFMYVHAEDVPDRYRDQVDSFRALAAAVDQIYDRSAHETGGHRHLRFVTDEKCQLEVLPVIVSATGDDSFRATILELVNLGYASKERKYVIFVEAMVYCGIATIIYDSDPSVGNVNNHSSGYARIDNGCWNAVAVAHELTHILGGVQQDAPHSSGGGHCVDEWDLMCYSDAPHYPNMQYLCPITMQELLDCNHDDYYHTDPPADTYLSTHWNVADSLYLTAHEAHQNLPPTVVISTTISGETLTAPATITVTALVSDSDGTVTKVEFYTGSTLLATDETSPYSYQWRAVASDSYSLTAKAYDDGAASTTSSPLLIVVAEPSIPPAQRSEDESAPSPRHLYLPLVSGKSKT